MKRHFGIPSVIGNYSIGIVIQKGSGWKQVAFFLPMVLTPQQPQGGLHKEDTGVILSLSLQG